MKAVIWGCNGQDGYYLTKLLQDKGIEVLGVSRSGNFLNIDITNYKEVSEFIKLSKPDFLFHLAANSTTNHSAWKENHDTIATGSLNILEAVKEFSKQTKVFLSGSGLQFVNQNKPIKETNSFDASSIYAAARIYSVYLGRYYRSLGLNVYVGYFFNHDSPLRSERRINKKIITIAKRISNGSIEKLIIGDPTVKKEFGFAGDIVKAIWLLIQQEAITEAVIGTGKAYSIRHWLNICFSLYGLNWKDHVVEQENFVAEYRTLVSDPETIFSLGWQPNVTIDELAKMMEES
jgi:GDPmannose 4,6-dehydratase